MVVAGETGRDEIVVLFFREPDEIAFYRHDLPALGRRLADGLPRRGQRIGYPYLKSVPTLPIGTGAALRNPKIGAEAQVRSAIEEHLTGGGMVVLTSHQDVGLAAGFTQRLELGG